MSDRHGDDFPLGDDPALDAELAALLGDPAVWEEPDPDLEDAVVAAIRGEVARAEVGRGGGLHEAGRPDRVRPIEPGDRAAPPGAPGAGHDATVVPIERAGRRWVSPLLGAAAALLAVAAIGIGARLADRPSGPDELVALAGTDLAPGATATAEVTGTSQGTRLVLDISDLPPAPEGQYYEAWLRESPEVGVSAGTFHLRGGDGEIVLWSGVTVDEYPLITVTLQDEGAGAASSGRVVLKGTVGG